MSSPELTPAQELAERLGIDEPDDKLLRFIGRAMADAEADVVGYLGRSIMPVVRTRNGVWPDIFAPGGWALTDESEPVRRIISATPETFAQDGGPPITTGTFTLVYEVGLDYINDPELSPIRRYVMAAAGNDYQLLNYLEGVLHMRGPVQSVSVSTEGQSKNVTYGHIGYTPPASRGTGSQDYPGALPKLTTLDRWRRANRRVHQAADIYYDPRWDGARGLVRDRDGFWNQPL